MLRGGRNSDQNATEAFPPKFLDNNLIRSINVQAASASSCRSLGAVTWTMPAQPQRLVRLQA